MSSVACGTRSSLRGRGSERSVERGQVLARSFVGRHELVSVVADRQHAYGDVRRAGVGKGMQALLDRRLAPRGEQVTHLVRVAVLQQALIVRRDLGFGEDA